MENKFALCLVTIVISLGSVLAQSDYVKDVEKWRSDEAADLKKEDGWLTVAGLFWLKDGVNTVGAGSQFDVRLSDNFTQGSLGEIEFKKRCGDVEGCRWG
jgi:hypothetical protein